MPGVGLVVQLRPGQLDFLQLAETLRAEVVNGARVRLRGPALLHTIAAMRGGLSPMGQGASMRNDAE